MNIRFLGHSGFQINDIVIDPFISGNPASNLNVADIKCKYILVTHDHFDHLGDAPQIAKNNDAPIITHFDLAQKLEADFGVKTIGMNLGGTVQLKGYKVKMTDARHATNLGQTTGFVITDESSNRKVYHAGDTCLFLDMQLIGDEGLDIAMIPIGDHFTMGIKDAIRAVGFLNPKKVVPMHYNTFPPIEQDPNHLAAGVSVPVEVFVVGESKTL